MRPTYTIADTPTAFEHRHGVHLACTAGELSRNALLTEKIVRHLRESFARKPPGMLQREFCEDWAALLGVTPTCVMQVVKRLTWRHVMPLTVEGET